MRAAKTGGTGLWPVPPDRETEPAGAPGPITGGGRFRAAGRMAMRRLLRATVPVAALAAGVLVLGPHLGCSRPAPPGPATVRGAVTFQGRPLPGGVVVFTPDKDRGTPGKPVRGEIGPDGTFKLGTQ